MKNRIRECRETAGLTMKQLAAISGVSIQAIQTIEAGTRGAINGPGILTIEKLADALNVIPAYLIGWSDNPMSQTLEQIAERREGKMHFYHVRSQKLSIDAVIIAESPQQAVSVALRHCYDYLPKKTEETFKKELMAEEVQTADDNWPRWIAGQEG